jgi:hypothetical protein
MVAMVARSKARRAAARWARAPSSSVQPEISAGSVMAQRLVDLAADACAELGGGALGERDDQDLVQGGPPADQDVQHQMFQQVGLARPRRGFDHDTAG